jgi:ribose 5-phosphate isomerase B
MIKPSYKKIGIAADHGGFGLKGIIVPFLTKNKFEPVDFGAKILNETDDYPDFVIPLARAVAAGEVFRGIASAVVA